jgi:hypothetical protein
MKNKTKVNSQRASLSRKESTDDKLQRLVFREVDRGRLNDLVTLFLKKS